MNGTPNDAEATLERARSEAQEYMRSGLSPIRIIRSRAKLPSSIVGFRFFCHTPAVWKLFGGMPVGPSELLETWTPAGMTPA